MNDFLIPHFEILKGAARENPSISIREWPIQPVNFVKLI